MNPSCSIGSPGQIEVVSGFGAISEATQGLVGDGEYGLCFESSRVDRDCILYEFDIEAQGLQLADKNVERLGHARFDRSLTLDDGLVNLGTAVDIVRLRGKQFLQDVRSAISFERPYFHLSEALSSELCLASQRLLGDE